MRGLLLISGGFDSAVAGYLMQKQGVEVTGLHFSNEPVTDGTPEKKSKEIVKKLGFKDLIIINISKALIEMTKKCNNRFYYILSKRLMWKIAEKVANEKGFDFIITGTALGQVGSQTLSNIKTIDSTVNIKVMHPLLGLDKQEIINIANKIETFKISKGPEMCAVLGPKHPATRSKIDVIEKEEEKYGMEEFVKQKFQ